MDRQLKRGTLEMVLLKLLAEKRWYGYELVKALVERSAGALEVGDGTLYPVLYRLEEAGWAETEWEAQGRGAPRKYYRITGAGKTQLDALVSDWEQFSSAIDGILES